MRSGSATMAAARRRPVLQPGAAASRAARSAPHSRQREAPPRWPSPRRRPPTAARSPPARRPAPALAPADDARTLRLIAAQPRAPGLVQTPSDAVAQVGDRQPRAAPARASPAAFDGREEQRAKPSASTSAARSAARSTALRGCLNQRSTRRPIQGSATASSSRAPSSSAPSVAKRHAQGAGVVVAAARTYSGSATNASGSAERTVAQAVTPATAPRRRRLGSGDVGRRATSAASVMTAAEQRFAQLRFRGRAAHSQMPKKRRANSASPHLAAQRAVEEEARRPAGPRARP